ncbi:hypothetical protein, unlikely [Trypanosoma brucei gambiense DAL972]|uniref:Uncharacterized protein n=1 Tax=Trypanosoma brucei gambiense (strain MHOM/CI/86/DAL972) TaxID=679716 RepID=C9ZZJ1_TRYB9|nr:hypothetical protein, unlikely [Trypanosoma brucei gambiense DAL972]CBH14840.1 hypothetical protein, unlikely [Trypanosoma brucei gambiense DAL972]|eukprot:XP_011777106.1 hypothetical protein, unlikely [Trypanosoma brucei gambiense DAL972]
MVGTKAVRFPTYTSNRLRAYHSARWVETGVRPLRDAFRCVEAVAFSSGRVTRGHGFRLSKYSVRLLGVPIAWYGAVAGVSEDSMGTEVSSSSFAPSSPT